MLVTTAKSGPVRVTMYIRLPTMLCYMVCCSSPNGLYSGIFGINIHQAGFLPTKTVSCGFILANYVTAAYYLVKLNHPHAKRDLNRGNISGYKDLLL